MRRGRVCGARGALGGGAIEGKKAWGSGVGGVMRLLLLAARDFHLLGFGMGGWFGV